MSKLTELCVNAQADAVAKLLGNGKLRIYTRSDTILAELAFAGFRPASEGMIETVRIKKEKDAKNTGKATKFRCVTNKGDLVLEGSVGKIGSGADFILSDVNIKKHAEVTINKFAYSVDG